MLTHEERKMAYRRLSQCNSNRFHLYQCRIIGQQQITREQYNYAIDNPQVLMSYIMNWSCHNQIWMCEFAMYATQFDDIAKIYYNIRRQLEMHQSKIPTPFRFYTPRLRSDRSSSSHAIEVFVACLFMNLFQYINGDEDNKRIDAFVDTFDPCVFGDVYVPFNIFAFWSVEELSRIYITEKEPRPGHVCIYVETIYHPEKYNTHKMYLVNAKGEYKQFYCHERVITLLFRFKWDVCIFKRVSTLHKAFHYVFDCSIYRVQKFLRNSE